LASIETLTTASAERAEATPPPAPRKIVAQKPAPATDEGDAENDLAEPKNVQPESDAKPEDDGDSAKTDEDGTSQPDCTRKADESSTATSISSVSADADSCTPCHKISD
jgi:hypothetical protein